MPLFADGLKKIRANLRRIHAGDIKPPLVKIGRFTTDQLAMLNQLRHEKNFSALNGDSVFRGKHLYNSRCTEDGYSIEEVLEQITSAIGGTATVHYTAKFTALRSAQRRTDRSGVAVVDEAVFECTSRYPSAELLSVIPRGDGKKSGKK